jgi:hypothetical protein
MLLFATTVWGNVILWKFYAVILGKHVMASPETSTGLVKDSCEDFPQQEEDDCDGGGGDDDHDHDDNDHDDSDDESYEEKRNNETSTVTLPVQRNTEDLLGYVAVNKHEGQPDFVIFS